MAKRKFYPVHPGVVFAEDFLNGLEISQYRLAKGIGVSQPRLNDLLRGKIDKFSLDALVNMLGHAGMRVELTVKRAA